METAFLGLDTSNYTSSVSLLWKNEFKQERSLLNVDDGQLGLRQSDAVFSHVKNLGELTRKLLKDEKTAIKGIGVSVSPRDCVESYMPCFLVGKMVGEALSAALDVPLYTFSHQAGHIAAALFSAGGEELFNKKFIAFHVSGGTTECVFVNNLIKKDIRLICSSNDLNGGQLIDRCAAMLGIPFPGGKGLDALSLNSTKSFKNKISFKDGNPCLSGIENQCQSKFKKEEEPCDIAKFCLDSLGSAILGMIEYAKSQIDCDTFVFSGGVMSNTILRKVISENCNAVFGTRELSADNSVGIAKLAEISFIRA
ncbi:MAG: peptidase M22 [Oscillospiraceae bacterium]